MGDPTDAGPSRLRALITEAGCTYESLARSINVIARENGDTHLRANRSSVAHWVAGSIPARRTRGYLAEALSRFLGRTVTSAELGFEGAAEREDLGLTLTEDPVRVLSDLTAADLGRRAFLSTAAYSLIALDAPLETSLAALQRTGHAVQAQRSVSVGRGDVEAVHELTTALTAVDERLGGEHGRGAVVTYLGQDVTALCRGPFASDRTRRRMFSAAAQVAYLAGWKAHDAGLESLAQRYYLQAYHLAARGESSAHAGYVLRILGHHALDIGRTTRCLDLAEAAWDRAEGHCDPQTLSLFALNLARSHAAVGEARETGRWLNRAEQLAARPGDEPPRWAALGGTPEARLASQTAKTWTALGRHADAEPLYQQAAARWSGASHPRIKALDLHYLGSSQAAQGHLDQACATWTAAVPTLREVRSARTRRAITEIRTWLKTPRHRESPAARELRAMLRAPVTP
jgi:tetratricopeptide (TPR) repeat protein